MSTIKSSDEHLILNADGSSKDIKFQANGVEKASLSSAGVFTATSFAGSGAALTGVGVAGISSSADATAITIDSSENVGVGTTSPQTILSLDENTDAIIGLNRETSGGNGGDLQVRAGAGKGSGNSGGDLYLCSGTGTSSANVGKIQFGRSTGDDSTMPPDEVWMTITNDGRGVSQFTARGWCRWNGTTINDSHNVSSVENTATGKYTVNWDVDFSNANYAVAGAGHADRNLGFDGAPSAAGVNLDSYSTSGSLESGNYQSLIAFGDGA